jgi:beta-lactamase regulating signal transducer with metallopeptidase domain
MFSWLIVHTIVVAAAVLIVTAAARCFRLGPAARHLLWLIVLIKFLTPPLVYWPWTLPVSVPDSPPATAAPSAAREVRFVIIDQTPADLVPTNQEPTPTPAPTPPAAAPHADPPTARPPATPSLSWDWSVAAAWVWLVGGVFTALRNGMRILRWRRRVARSFPVPQWLVEQVRDIAGSIGVRPPRIVVLPGVASPMVWGFGAARLIWPLGLEDRLSAEGRRAVLLHELAHLRRRDHRIGWLLLAGASVWWWHPLFWWVRRRLTQEAELACDAWVVGAAPDGRRAYAEALLEVSERLASTAAVPALGAASGRRDLERRLVMIMKGPAGRRLSWAGLASVGVLGLLTLPAWTLGQDPKSKPAPSTAPILSGVADPAAPTSVAPPAAAPVPAGRSADVFFYPATTIRAADPTARGGDSDRDKKIKDLEDKVEQLLKELQELRGPTAAGLDYNRIPAVDAFYRKLAGNALAPPTAVAAPPDEVITLTRVSYKLKAQTAEALAGFLKDNVKTSILETKAEGETLTVTTTPEAQEAIGQFIALIQGKPLGRPGAMGPGGGMSPFFGPGPGGTGGFYGGPSGGTFVPGPGNTGGFGQPNSGGTSRPAAAPGGLPPGAPMGGGTTRSAPAPGGLTPPAGGTSRPPGN